MSREGIGAHTSVRIDFVEVVRIELLEGVELVSLWLLEATAAALRGLALRFERSCLCLP
jgi:hypothetical protein